MGVRVWWVAVGVACAAVAVVAMQGYGATVYFESTSDALFRAYVGRRLLAAAGLAAIVVFGAVAVRGLTRKTWAGVACLVLAMGVLGAGHVDALRRLRYVDGSAGDLLAGYVPTPTATETHHFASPGPGAIRMWVTPERYGQACGLAREALRAWADPGSMTTGTACEARARRGELDVELSVRAERDATRIVLTARPSWAPR